MILLYSTFVGEELFMQMRRLYCDEQQEGNYLCILID